MKTLCSVQKIVIRQAFQNPWAARALICSPCIGLVPSNGGFSCKSTDPLSLVISGDYFPDTHLESRLQTVHPLTELIDSRPGGDTV